MSYTLDAMISVLQKTEVAARTQTSDNRHIRLHLENQDEQDCYNIASANNWIIDSYGKMYAFTYAGLIELHRLLESKKEKSSKLTMIRVEFLAIWLAAISTAFSAVTLWIVASGHYWPPPVREIPVRIVNVIEALPNHTLPAKNNKKETEPRKPDADASKSETNIHEN